MHRKIEVKNLSLFRKIRELSNPSKFKILELTQNETMNITLLAKKVNLAFNKCSNYCTQLEASHLLVKEKDSKNVLVKSKIDLIKLNKELSV